jgi:hypothetical protein
MDNVCMKVAKIKSFGGSSPKVVDAKVPGLPSALVVEAQR